MVENSNRDLVNPEFNLDIFTLDCFIYFMLSMNI